jgi:hypothetical protein
VEAGGYCFGPLACLGPTEFRHIKAYVKDANGPPSTKSVHNQVLVIASKSNGESREVPLADRVRVWVVEEAVVDVNALEVRTESKQGGLEM